MNTPPDNADQVLLSIEQLTQRHAKMNDMKVRAQTNLENAQRQLKKFETEALEQFGTSDLDELKTKLVEMEAANHKQQHDYQNHLLHIEQELKSIESKHAESQSQDA